MLRDLFFVSVWVIGFGVWFWLVQVLVLLLILVNLYFVGCGWCFLLVCGVVVELLFNNFFGLILLVFISFSQVLIFFWCFVSLCCCCFFFLCFFLVIILNFLSIFLRMLMENLWVIVWRVWMLFKFCNIMDIIKKIF